MNGSEGLPGSESDAETLSPLPKVIPFGQDRESGRSDLVDTDEPLPPVWRDADGHDEWCEGSWDQPVGRSSPCGCGDRAETGVYPDLVRTKEDQR